MISLWYGGCGASVDTVDALLPTTCTGLLVFAFEFSSSTRATCLPCTGTGKMASLLSLSDCWIMTGLVAFESITSRMLSTECAVYDITMENTYTRAKALLQVGQAKGFVWESRAGQRMDDSIKRKYIGWLRGVGSSEACWVGGAAGRHQLKCRQPHRARARGDNAFRGRRPLILEIVSTYGSEGAALGDQSLSMIFHRWYRSAAQMENAARNSRHPATAALSWRDVVHKRHVHQRNQFFAPEGS